jgi:tRNA A37 threonylcarbamoyladenosine biosynthesis protein TsaE
MESEDDLRATGILAELEDYDYIVVEWPKRTHLYADGSWLQIHCIFDGEKRQLEITE